MAAAICLLGVNCESHRGFLVETLTFAIEEHGFQDCSASAAAALGALAASGTRGAASTLVDVGYPRAGSEPARRSPSRSATVRCETRR